MSMHVVNHVPLLVTLPNGEIGFNVPDRTPAVIRARLLDFKDTLLEAAATTREVVLGADMDCTHTLIGGVYTRTLLIPKGRLLVGKIHRKECVNIVAKGDISVLTETGSGRFQAGHVAVSAAGIMKLGYAHEDTIFINVFRTDETDIEKIEAEIACESFEALEQQEAPCLSLGSE